MEGLKADFAKDWIHHDEEADCDGNGNSYECPFLERWAGGRDEVCEDYAKGHGEDYPDYEEAVEEGEGFKRWCENVWFLRCCDFVSG